MVKQKNKKNIHDKNKKNIDTTSFLKTVEISEFDINSLNNDIKDKDVEEIVFKYLNLKKKINLLWNKIN